MQFLAQALSQAASLHQEYCVWKEGRKFQTLSPLQGVDQVGRTTIIAAMIAKLLSGGGVLVALRS